MTVTANSGSPTPAPTNGLTPGASFVRSLFGSGTSATAGTSTGTGTSDAPASGDEQGGWWDRIKSFFTTFRNSGGVGSTIGGLLGLGGAWFAGNFFGGGIMSTILTVALAIPMMLIGSDSIGGWINGLLGNSNAPAAPAAGNTPAPAVARNNAAQPTSQTQAQPTSVAITPTGPVTVKTDDELARLVAAIDNNTDRVYLSLDAARRVQVTPVADSVPVGDGISKLSDLRQLVLDQGGSLTAGIAFTPMSNGRISVTAAGLPNPSTGRTV